MHETFDHTADLDKLFAEAGQALFETIIPHLATVRLDRRVDITVAGAERDYLLFDWLKELLYRFDAEHLLLGKFEVHVNEKGLIGSAWGEPLDRARHDLEHEVKAITYHGLRVEPAEGGWLAEVIVDI